MKTNLTLLTVILLITLSCKNESKISGIDPKQEIKNINVQGEIIETPFKSEVACNDRIFTFELPLFEGDKDAVSRLENDVFSLLVDDFINVTYAQGTPTQEVYQLYVKQRNDELCKNPNKGMQHIEVKHVSESNDFVSFELEYIKDNAASSYIRSYRKNNMKPIYLQELIRPEKAQDVQVIYDINLQAEAVSLALNVHPEDQDFFQEFIKEKVFVFEPGSFKKLIPGLRKSADGDIYLQVGKQIELPQRLSYLSNVIVLDIALAELDAYLDFSKIR